MFKKVVQRKPNSSNEASASTFVLHRVALYTERIRQDLDAQIDKPSGRICVPGFHWTGVFLSHLGGVPSVCR
jgi:hypothetical protein